MSEPTDWAVVLFGAASDEPPAETLNDTLHARLRDEPPDLNFLLKHRPKYPNP